MKFSTIGLLAMASCGLAKEMEQDMEKSARLYQPGIMHEYIKAKKMETHARQRANGMMDSKKYKPVKKRVTCSDGLASAVKGDANSTFRCKNMDLISFASHADLGSKKGEGSSSWGWTSPEGREFVAIGQSDAAAFAEINKAGKLVYLGRLPAYSTPSIWREIRGYKNYMVIGSEAEGHNVQIFDMTKLLTIDPKSPVTFSNQKDLTGLFKGLPIGRSHTISVNEETGFAFANGAAPRTDKCRAGLIFIDLKDPSKPVSPGCASQDGYVHDAQCRIYRGPHKKYQGREICYGYNEDTLTIFDVQDKTNTSIISRTSYTGASYTHQGWVLDDQNQEFLLLDDEYDEHDRKGLGKDGHPITYIWDIRNLEAPKQTGYYKSEARGIDHNQYVVGKYTFQSNYGSGIRVLDVSSIPSDPTGSQVEEVAYFDVYPEDDNQPGGGVVDFVGTWSSYAFFKSGYIFVNTIERGGFVLKMQQRDMNF